MAKMLMKGNFAKKSFYHYAFKNVISTTKCNPISAVVAVLVVFGFGRSGLLVRAM